VHFLLNEVIFLLISPYYTMLVIPTLSYNKFTKVFNVYNHLAWQ